jgi:hypothetical protein
MPKDNFNDSGFDEMLVSVRADTRGFAADIAKMRADLEGPLAQGADRAGRLIEGALVRAIRTGSLGFEDLRRVALSVMADIAASAIRAGLSQLSGGGGGGQNSGSGGDPNGGGGLIGIGLGLASLLLGSPGRAHGGGVSAGRAYMVGERGPEVFVPGTTGRVENFARNAGSGGQGRDIRITVNMAGSGDADRPRMAQTGKQLARALRAALAEG